MAGANLQHGGVTIDDMEAFKKRPGTEFHTQASEVSNLHGMGVKAVVP